MKNNKIAIAGIIVAFLAVCFSVYAIYARMDTKQGFSGGYENSFSGGVTNTSTTVGMVATTTNPILSANTSRQYALICNNSAYPVYLHLVGLTATTTGVSVNTGIPLSPVGLTTSSLNVCYEIEPQNLYLGAIVGIGASTGTVTVVEK